MVNTAAPPRPLTKELTVWLNALIFVGFIAFLVFTVEGTLAWIAGSFAHSAMVGLVVLAILGLPTLYWLVSTCMRRAIAAERDLLAPPPAS